MENTSTESQRVTWYRTPLDKETMRELNAKSDLKGWAQSLGHLSLLACTGSLTLYSIGRWPWWVTALLLFTHGTVAAFMINAVHELGHKSVFKTQALNQFFLRIFAFIGWNNFEHFYLSHMRHHQYTLHQPDDLEVVLPMRVVTKEFFKTGFVKLARPHMILDNLRLARGQFRGEWENVLFPQDQPEKALPTIRWSRTVLIGHGLIFLISMILGFALSPVWFMVPVLVSLTPHYGGWLFFLCNNTQHIGLQDDVDDFRLCCRSFTTNPLVQFLYWHMNYHIEHHMYAAVPCYNLGKLHRAIKHELPPTPHGLVATWREIAEIQRKQEEDPSYQHVALIPAH